MTLHVPDGTGDLWGSVATIGLDGSIQYSLPFLMESRGGDSDLLLVQLISRFVVDEVGWRWR